MNFDDLFDCEITEIDGGYDAELTLRRGLHVAWGWSHDSGVSLKLRSEALPAIGKRVMVNGRAIKGQEPRIRRRRPCVPRRREYGGKVPWA